MYTRIWILLLIVLLRLRFSYPICDYNEFDTLICETYSGCHYKSFYNVTCENIFQLDENALYLSANEIIWKLVFTNSTLTSLSSSFFNNFHVSQTKMLYLNNTKIEEIKRKSLSNFENLELLNIAENSLTKFYGGTLDGLRYLKYLNLSSNLLSCLDDELFVDLELIETIDLSHNHLRNISNNIFQTNPNLNTLLLNNNKIIQILDYTFSNCLQLRILNLAMNNIYKINHYSFDNIFMETSLLHNTELDLSYNKLLHLDGMIFKEAKIQSLKINNNFLYIDKNFFLSLPEISDLDLSYIAPIDLKFVNLKGALILQHTIFQSESEFGDLIIKLDLRSTMIRLNLFSFKRARNLKYLFLDNNNITNINIDLFAELDKLQFLSLTNNSLNIIPIGIFRSLHILQNLYLNNNNISTLELGVFSGLESLTTLNLASNKLRNLDADVLCNLLHIEEIDLTNNLFSYFNMEDFVIHMHRSNAAITIKIILDSNFWYCNGLQKAMTIARKNNIFIPKGSSYKVYNLKGIACQKDNISLDITSQISEQKLVITKSTSGSTTTGATQRTPNQHTETDYVNHILTDFQETADSILTYTYTSDFKHQFINRKPSTATQQKPVHEKYLFSTQANNIVLEQMVNNSNKISKTLKTISDIRGLLIFIIIVLCIIICWKIYTKFFKGIKSQPDVADNRSQSCNIELIDNNKNNDNED